MVSSERVARSKAIQRRTGRTFYLATRFLPTRVRRSTYALYGFFRIADEVVDDADRARPSEQRAELEAIRDAVLGEDEPDDEVLAAFCEVLAANDIPDAEVAVFLDAMETDIDTDAYESRAALDDYMRGSAVAVAHMMTYVMQPDDVAAALPHAGALGRAFQLTNFLRDVREDVVERDRIYLPHSVLREHGVAPEDVRRFEMSAGFVDAMRSELRRTESLYREGVAGIAHLPADCQFPVLLAAVLYADYHRAIREREFDVLSERPELGTVRKVSLTARTWWRWRRTGRDPVATFESVSALP